MSVTRREFIGALGAFIGVAVASQFDRQLGIMARALAGPQEWVLSFDEDGLEQVLRECAKISGPPADDCEYSICVHLNISEYNFWQLATLTAPDGSQWTTMDGENWTCGDRRMVL